MGTAPKSTTSKKLDKTKPYATIHGGDGVSYEQDGSHFNAKFEFTGKAADKPAKEDAALTDADREAGKGDLAKGQMPDFNKPLEDGGGAGGKTKSWPQGTPESEKVVAEHDKDEAKK